MFCIEKVRLAILVAVPRVGSHLIFLVVFNLVGLLNNSVSHMIWEATLIFPLYRQGLVTGQLFWNILCLLVTDTLQDGNPARLSSRWNTYLLCAFYLVCICNRLKHYFPLYQLRQAPSSKKRNALLVSGTMIGLHRTFSARAVPVFKLQKTNYESIIPNLLLNLDFNNWQSR